MGISAATGWADGLLVTSGWVLLAVGGLLLLWALFGDRSRGRKRCPKCWYDMSGAVARQEEDGRGVFTCPECGRVVNGERGLARTRRNWSWAALGALIVFGSVDSRYVLPRIEREGWLALLPSSILVFIAPLGGADWEIEHEGGRRFFAPPYHSLARRFEFRGSHEGTWDWQQAVLARRIYSAHPCETRTLLSFPAVWTTDLPLRVTLNAGHVRFAPKGCTVRVRMHGSDRWSNETDLPAPYPAVSGGPITQSLVRLDVEARWKGLVIWSGELSERVELAGAFSQLMKSTSGSDCHESIKAGLPRLLLFEGEWRVTLDGLSLKPFTLAARVEVKHSDEVRGIVELVRPNGGCRDFDWSGPGPNFGGAVRWLGRTPSREECLDGDWTLRFVSDPDLAMFDYATPERVERDKQLPECVNRYWLGVLEIPAVIDTSWEDARVAQPPR